MGKISQEQLLSMGIADAFDGSEIGFLVALLDEHICDWTKERRSKFKPLFDDLSHLHARLTANGHDYGLRKQNRWANDPDPTKETKYVNVICTCGARFQVGYEEQGSPRYAWEITCPKHRPLGTRRLLGSINVRGVPEKPIDAQLVIQQAIVHHTDALNLSEDFSFETYVKF